MFLISTLVPKASVPTGRIEMLASQRSEPSSMRTSLTSSDSKRGAEFTEVGGGLLGRADVGLAHALDQGHARAVEVDQRGVGIVDAARGARVHGLAGVLFHVDARDADAAGGAVGQIDVEVTAHADRQVVLADLVVLRHVRIEVVLAVEQRVRGDLAADSQADQDDAADRLAVGHRQRTGMAQADRAHVRVGRRAELGSAAAEHLRLGIELDVALEPDDSFDLGHEAPSLADVPHPVRRRRRVAAFVKSRSGDPVGCFQGTRPGYAQGASACRSGGVRP